MGQKVTALLIIVVLLLTPIFIYFFVGFEIIYMLFGRQENLMIPGVANRTETDSNFLNDRSWFEDNERNFYSRYRT